MIPDPIPVTGIGVTQDGTPLLDAAVIDCTTGDAITLVPSVEPANADVTDDDFVWSTDTLVPVVTGRTAVFTPVIAGSYVIGLTVGELSMSFTIIAVAPAIQSVDVFAFGYGETAIADEASLDAETGAVVSFTPVPTPMNADAADEDYVWSVTPTGASLVQTGKVAEVTFTDAGTYTVGLTVDTVSWSCTMVVTPAA